jgi:hypothetical protein
MDNPLALRSAAKHAALERYLHLATWGLWGHKRREVRLELEGNIRDMAGDYQVFGLSESDAIDRVLEEFGPPEKVSLGMAKVYAVPTLLRNTFIAVTLAGLGISLLNSSAAQIASTSNGVVPICPEYTSKTKTGQLVILRKIANDCRTDLESSWVELTSLKTLLETKGVKYVHDKDGLLLTFPGDKPIRIEMHPEIDATRGSVDVRSFKRNGQTYLNTNFLIEYIAYNSKLPVTLRGWINPRLSVGNTSLEFGTTDNPVQARRLFESMFLGAFYGHYKRFVGSQDMAPFPLYPRYFLSHPYRHVIKVNDPPGTVYGTMARYRRHPRGSDTTDYAPVSSDGTVELYFPWSKIEFVTDLNLMQPEPINGRVRVLLVRSNGRIDMNGRGWELVLPPTRISDGLTK